MASDLLFELGTEELPSGAVWPLADALATNLVNALNKAELSFGNVQAYATPRRLAVLVHDVEEQQPEQTITRKGPAYAASLDDQGQPSPALQGFARSCGVGVDQLSKLMTEKGERWVYEAIKPGVATSVLLPDMISQAVSDLPISKPMRWGHGDDEFARPVHWAVLLFGNQVITTQLLGVTTGSHSIGHRFHHPQRIEITSPSAYTALLKKAYVIADFSERRKMILDKVTAIAEESNFQAVMPDSLVDEVTSIVEWPEPLMADFEANFLDVPAEALIASMQSHQKCFALRDQEGRLQPHFITVSNIVSERPEQVVAGNEKVMRARLSDATFFYNQDKKKPLSEYIAATDKVVFQKRLGTLADKADRIKALMAFLVQPLALNNAHASRSAELSKCDLMTGMVGEFPELQGLMGYYYALNDQEAEPIATALNEQYLPRFAADTLPQTNLGMALSLADRMDTLVGIFAIGQKPTGVKDPFKLRRHALAVVRMLIATPAPINLSMLIEQALAGYPEANKLDKNVGVELMSFILERMQSHYQSQAIPSTVVHAVRARQEDWLHDTDNRIKALLEFINLPEATSLSVACKRVNNILQKASLPKDELMIDSSLLNEAAEKVLFEQIQAMEKSVDSLYLQGQYSKILNQLARMRDPVDRFFDNVMVMVDNESIKINRLSLLARLQKLMQGVADISLLTIEK